VFQEKQTEYLTGKEKKQVLNQTIEDLEKMKQRVTVTNTAAQYMERHNITISPDGSMSFNKEIKGQKMKGIPHNLFSDVKFTNVFVFEDKLCVISKTQLPVEGNPIYSTHIVLYNADTDTVNSFDENTQVMDGNKKLQSYEEFILKRVKDQK
jgi:hypothetical protein